MQTEKCNNSEFAIHLLIKTLIKHKYDVVKKSVKIGGRLYHGHCVIKANGVKLYCLFKKDHFNTFYRQFINFMLKHKDFCGKGDSINAKSLKYAHTRNCKLILFIHPTKITCIEPECMIGICENNNLFYVQNCLNPYYKNGSYKPNNEFVYSLPKEMLRSFELEELENA